MSDYLLSEVDLKRCLEALQGEFYRMPIGLTREERRAYIGDIARRNSYGLTPEVASRISENTKTAYLSKYPTEDLEDINTHLEYYISLGKLCGGTKISGDTREEIGNNIREAFNKSKMLSDKVSLNREQLKDHGERVLKTYTNSDPQTPLNEFIDL